MRVNLSTVQHVGKPGNAAAWLTGLPKGRSAAGRVMVWIAALVLCSACASRQAAPTGRSPQGRADLAQLAPGAIVIVPQPGAIVLAPTPRHGRLESTGEGAARATRAVLDTPSLGHRQLDAAVGVLGFAATPFAATYGAISASRQQLSSDQLASARQELTELMRSNAAPGFLCRQVVESARLKTRRRLVCADESPAASDPPGVSARLEVAIDEFLLKALKAGGDDYALSIGARVRLIRAADDEVFFARSYRYQSGSAFFVDWTRHGGLEGVAQTGYRTLAEQIARDLFEPAAEPPLLISPGQPHPRAHLPPLRHGKPGPGPIQAQADRCGTGRAGTPVVRQRCCAALVRYPRPASRQASDREDGGAVPPAGAESSLPEPSPLDETTEMETHLNRKTQRGFLALQPPAPQPAQKDDVR